MGVAGDFLPRVLESTGRMVDLRQIKQHRKRPLRIGIDVSAWIYRAGFAFGEKLMHDERPLTAYGRAQCQREQETVDHEPANEEKMTETIRDYCEACANYVLRRLELLKEGSSAHLLVVFDGRTPPIKTATVSQRRKSREAYQSIQGRDTGNTENTTNETTNQNNLTVEADIEQRVKANRRAGPGEHVSRIVDVIIEKLRERAKPKANGSIPHEDYLATWMVAPYEADSQLAYLSKQSYIDLVITEDTDLIAHGCRSVLYKCLENHNSANSDGSSNNNNTNNASEIHIDITRGKLVEFHDLGGTKVFSGPSKPDLTDFTPVMMAVLFVLLGCDYNGHRKLKGIGILKACRIVRKAFLESSSKTNTTTSENELSHESSPESRHHQNMVPMSPSSVASSPRRKTKKLSILDIVWKEAYEQSYESSSFYSEEFKRDYQKSFVEALWMYRHPIVFDPMIRSCIQSPSPVSDNLGDPELMGNCWEYSELACDPIRIMQVVGEVPPTQEECISIAEGRTHTQWKLRKPTPIYSNNSNGQNPTESTRKRKSPISSTLSNSQKRNSNGKNRSPAFVSKRTFHRHNHPSEKENNNAAAPNSTQSDRRRSLDSDEIASVAAGGFKKDDKRPSNGSFMSRNLFPGGTQSTQDSHESEKTVPLSASPELPKSPNLLASTTPEHSTQSSSKATTLSINASGTQSSSKASQSQKTNSQSISQSSKMSVNLLASSSQSHGFETPVQTQQHDDLQTPLPPRQLGSSRAPSQNLSTQEELFFETQPKLDFHQSPPPPQDEEEELFTQELQSMKTPRTLPKQKPWGFQTP